MIWVPPHLRPFLKEAEVDISVCLLKREVKVKVTKFCVGWEDLIHVYKLTKLDYVSLMVCEELS